MADRLTELLAQNAGLGDEEAALQLQMLRAKTLRDRAAVDPRRTTGKGGMFSALARGVNAYRGGTMEAEADTTRAGLDARRMELRQAAQESVGGLPSLTPEIDPRTGGYGVVPPEAITQHRALGQALGLSPVPDLAKRGAAITGEAEKAQADAAKLANARALGMVVLPDGQVVPASSMGLSYDAERGGWYKRGGEMGLIDPDPAAVEAKGKRAAAAAGATSSTFPIEGPDGKPLIVEKPRASGAPARPVKVEGLKSPAGGALPTSEAKPPVKALSTAEATALENDNRQLENLIMLKDTFRPEFAGQGILGGAKVSIAQTVGSSNLPGSNLPLAKWWQHFNKMVANVERKRDLGSAITPMENRIYQMAQTIRPGMPPEAVRAELERVIEQAKAELVGQGAALKAGNKAGRAVDATAPNQAADPGDVDALLKLYGEGN